MDYKTKPATREDLRKLAKMFDLLAHTVGMMNKPVVELLDKMQDIMKFVHYEIIENDILPHNIPARGFFEIDGSYVIQIPEHIYIGAVDGIGAYRVIIMHEIFHPFMCMMGYMPFLERNYGNNELAPYESVEWQVKCITGEYMMDYELTKCMSVEEIKNKCGVSISSAKKRKKY